MGESQKEGLRAGPTELVAHTGPKNAPSPTPVSQREDRELMTPTTVTVVPCFNEAKRLPPEVFPTFAARHAGVRFLFVDDGSTDATGAWLVLHLPVYDTRCGAKIVGGFEDLAAAPEQPFRARWIFDLGPLARFSILWGVDVPSRIVEYPVKTWRDLA